MDAHTASHTPVTIGSTAVDPSMSPGNGCRAPSTHMYLSPDGEVRACCQNQRSIGWIQHDRLTAIWAGHHRRRTVAALAVGDFTHGCQTCADEIAAEGRQAAYASRFDDQPDMPLDGWPTSIDFNLSNRCNLACVQCNALLSSTIRSQRTDLAPLVGVYGDDFFDDLRQFIPHLDRAQFAGGEPFLGDENFRVWELIAELAPGLDITTVTNATRITARELDILERVPMNLVVSIDAASAATFEAIRVGSDFDAVIRNLDRLLDYTRSKGTVLSINHCLMVQNFHEFADLLLLAESRGVAVQVSVVRGPADCALSMMADDRLVEVRDTFARQDPEVAPRLSINLDVWRRETQRVASWLRSGDGTRASDFNHTRYAQTMFPVPGEPVSFGEIRGRLADLAQEPGVLELRATPDLIISEDRDGFAEVLGLQSGALLGRHVNDLGGLAEQRWGPAVDVEFVATGDELHEVEATYDEVIGRTAMAPVRGEDGWTAAISVLIAIRRR